LVGIAGPHSIAMAKPTCSIKMYNRADASLRSAAGSWRSLMNHEKAFASCDDGALAEGYSDAVVGLLANRWGQFDVFVSVSERNSAFRRWAIRHIDATASSDDLMKVVRNAAGCTGSANTRVVCGEVERAARDALKD
jgi:hypothetical protein